MPPKPKYSKEDIAKTALEIIKETGAGSLTARELGKRLGMSVSPIFSVYPNMDSVIEAARDIALKEFTLKLHDCLNYTPAFKKMGMTFVLFGKNEPELFKLLFLHPNGKQYGFEHVISDLGEIHNVCMEVIIRDYGITQEQARFVFEQLWTMTLGFGAMCCMGVCDFSEEELKRRLSAAFISNIMFVKNGNKDVIDYDIEYNANGMYHGKKLNDFSELLSEKN